MKYLLSAFLLVTSVFVYAQTARNVGDFYALKVYDKITLILEKSDHNEVLVSSEDVETINKNGELKIRMAPAKLLQGGQVKVTVRYTALTDLQASQGAVISSRDTLDGRLLSITSNEASEINLNIDVQTLNVKVNSGGQLRLTGAADHQEVIVNTAGKYFGSELESETATITANAGGTAEVNSSGAVDATARAGGIIEVFGNPDEKREKTLFGGKIIYN